jgi:hypothetical protein
MQVTQGNGQAAGTLTGNPTSQSGESGGDARPGLSRGDIQQMTNNAQQLLNTASQLQKQMIQSGANQKDLQPVDDVVKGLKALSDTKSYADPKELAQIASETLSKVQKVDLDLRKRFDTSNQQLFLGTEEMPTQFKDSIQDYFKALGKGQSQPAQPPTPPASTTNGTGRGGVIKK